MFNKLDDILERYNFLESELTKAEVLSNTKLTIAYTQELASVSDIATAYQQYKAQIAYEKELEELIQTESDKELKEAGLLELESVRAAIKALEQSMRVLLLPKDPNDTKNVILEVRAGVGGDEAAIFAADLLRMYYRYASSIGMQVDTVDIENILSLKSTKEAVLVIKGQDVFSKFKYESGVHRVQRVPETETKGRVHTSTASVVVFPEQAEVELNIDPKDIRIDLYRSSGAGGQHVNKTESAVRLTHLPTGIVVACQDERSQIKNRDKAFSILRAKLYDYLSSKEHESLNQVKKVAIGTGDRSEKIRTYNFPQSRITDHRINYTSYNLPAVLGGELEPFVQELRAADTAKRLADHKI